MKRSLQLQILISILTAGVMFSSCGNIDIVKRKYRPGFHVDVSKKRQKTKVATASFVRESHKLEKLNTVPSKTFNPVNVHSDIEFIASTKKIEPVKTQNSHGTVGSLLSLPDFSKLSFDRKLKKIKNEIFKPKPRGGNHWMKWVAFGAGILSMVLGFMAVLMAFLLASSYLIWPALLLSAAAIVFALLYKNANGTDPKAKLGLIFGIIGGGLAVIALIVWAIWVSQAIAPVL